MPNCPREHPSRLWWFFVGIVFAMAFCNAPKAKAATGCVPHHSPAGGRFTPTLFTGNGCPPNLTCYVNQAGIVEPIKLNKIGWTYGIGPMHGVCMVDARGVCDEIASECIANQEDRPQQPGDVAGAQVIAWWKFFWTDPDADLHRCNVAFGAGFDKSGQFPPGPPAGGWPPCSIPTPTKTASPSPSNPPSTASPTVSRTVIFSPTAITTATPAPTVQYICVTVTPHP